MTKAREIVTPGQVVYDLSEVPSTDPSLLVVVDPDAGTVAEQDTKTRKMIRHTEANERFNTSNDARCVEAVYVGESLSETVYTFPSDRLGVPKTTETTFNRPPAIWAQGQLLAEVYKHTDVVETDMMRANVEGQVLLAAKDILLDEGAYEAGAVSEESSDEDRRTGVKCPECEAPVLEEEPIEEDEPLGTGAAEAFSIIACSECDWKAEEHWELVGTSEIS